MKRFLVFLLVGSGGLLLSREWVYLPLLDAWYESLVVDTGVDAIFWSLTLLFCAPLALIGSDEDDGAFGGCLCILVMIGVLFLSLAIKLGLGFWGYDIPFFHPEFGMD